MGPATGLEAPATIVGPALAPPHMAGRERAPTRDGPSDARHALQIDLGQGQPHAVGRPRNHVPPRVDDQRVPVALPQLRVVVPPVLGRRQDVALTLDGPRAEVAPSGPGRS